MYPSYEVMVEPDDGQAPEAKRVGFPFVGRESARKLWRRLNRASVLRKIMPLDPPRAWFTYVVEVCDGKRTKVGDTGIIYNPPGTAPAAPL